MLRLIKKSDYKIKFSTLSKLNALEIKKLKKLLVKKKKIIAVPFAMSGLAREVRLF